MNRRALGKQGDASPLNEGTQRLEEHLKAKQDD
jgi:hypothetical protein